VKARHSPIKFSEKTGLLALRRGPFWSASSGRTDRLRRGVAGQGAAAVRNGFFNYCGHNRSQLIEAGAQCSQGLAKNEIYQFRRVVAV
jgi:hypothetical protein